LQLVRLELYGFKSFSGKTEFSFSPGITGFVGPNGCGKSNVVDAIRWVLGEQNPRVLRANRMEDLIYAGTEHSQHKNYAEVSIVLDNSDKEIPLDYREVTVARRYYRSGDSEYFINRVPCRLKDIHELLASTSLGRGTYSIIGQGQVEEVINSRPEERRTMFEEAAGISLLKMRKRDGLKKLADTRVNLTRIQDIVHELQGQEDEVRESAAIAQEFLKHKEQAEKVELSLWASKYTDLHRRLEKLEQRKQQLTDSGDQLQAQLLQRQRDLTASTAKMQECSDIITALEQNRAKLTQQKTQMEYEVQLSQQRQQDYLNLVQQGQQQLSRLQAQMEQGQEEQVVAQDKLAELNKQLKAYTLALRRRTSAAGLGRRLLAAAEKYRGKADDLIVQAAMSSNETATSRDKIHQTVAELNGQQVSLGQEIEEWRQEAAQAQAEEENLTETLAQLQNQRQGICSALDEVTAQLENLTQRREDLTSSKNRLANGHNAMEQKLEMLKSMEQDLQGFSRGTRSALKASRRNELSGVLGAVADLIQVPNPQHSLAIETALGGALNYVVCDNEESCRGAIEMLKSTGGGRATFVPVTAARRRNARSKPSGFGQPIIGWGDELVSSRQQEIVKMFLGEVLIAENLEIATKLAQEINYRYKIVTLDGEVISRGLFTGGTSGKQGQGPLQRKASIQELQQRMVEQNGELEELSRNLEKIQVEFSQIQPELEEKNRELENCQREIVRTQAQAQQAGERVKRAKAREDQSQQRMDEVKASLRRAEQALEGIATKIDQDKLGLEKQKQARHALQGMEGQLKDMVSLWASRQNSLQLTIYSLESRGEDMQRQITMIADQQLELSQRQHSVKAEVAEKQQQSQALAEKIEQANHALTEISQGLETACASLDCQVASQAQLKEEIQLANQEISVTKDNLEEVKKTLHEAEVKKARWQTEEEGLVSQLGAQFGLSAHQGLQHLDDRYTGNELAAQLRKLQGRMDEMGQVNLASIQQHQKLVQRLDFLQQQEADLVQAERDILGLVEELDKKIRELFMSTFENVQQQFTEIFQTLFSGGSAYLSLNQQEDLLDAGIEIYARPPGKKTQTLSLLSGGEKAMTAIALLFALQSVRPAPFCILDEIEAALDDVNIVRFANYVRQLAGDMQFILITHRRETMEHSDSLYGITLAKDGSSKPISVALNTVDKG